MISSSVRSLLLFEEEVIKTVTVTQRQEFGWMKQQTSSCVGLSMVRLLVSCFWLVRRQLSSSSRFGTDYFFFYFSFSRTSAHFLFSLFFFFFRKQVQVERDRTFLFNEIASFEQLRVTIEIISYYRWANFSSINPSVTWFAIRNSRFVPRNSLRIIK